MTNHETQVHFEMLADAGRQGGLDKYDDVIIKQHPGYPLKKFLTDFNPPFSYSVVDEKSEYPFGPGWTWSIALTLREFLWR